MKIKDEVGQRIEEKIRRFKSRAGHKKLMSDILYPSRQREIDRAVANAYVDELQEKIKQLHPLIQSLRGHIDYIGDPDKYVAAYLLIGKSYTTLKAVGILAREGYSFQTTELVRSAIESLHLASLFLEEKQDKLLERWFKGETIDNNTARQAINNAVNKMKKEIGQAPVPMREALSDVYSVYSSFTHSDYVALFEFIDLFKEDFDFDQSAQLHYNRRGLHIIGNLYVNILLGLKNFYIRKHDEENLAKVEALLSKESQSFATPEEIKKESERYR